MTRNRLILICVIISVIGFFGIYIADLVDGPAVFELCDVDYRSAGEYVRICGSVDGFRWAGSSVNIIVVEGNCTMPVVFYPSSFKGIDTEALMSGAICCEGRIAVDGGKVRLTGEIIEKKE